MYTRQISEVFVHLAHPCFQSPLCRERQLDCVGFPKCLKGLGFELNFWIVNLNMNTDTQPTYHIQPLLKLLLT